MRTSAPSYCVCGLNGKHSSPQCCLIVLLTSFVYIGGAFVNVLHMQMMCTSHILGGLCSIYLLYVRSMPVINYNKLI